MTARTAHARQVAADGDWMDAAACKGRTPLFFPPKAERPQARERREAKASGCAAAARCSRSAASSPASHHEYGFWAGESEEDRHLAGFTVSAPIGIRARNRAG